MLLCCLIHQATASASVFSYVDAWSSEATWGNQPIPAAGEMVVIPKGKVIVLDVSTPILDMILIDGRFYNNVRWSSTILSCFLKILCAVLYKAINETFY